MGKFLAAISIVIHFYMAATSTSYAGSGVVGEINIPSELTRYAYAVPAPTAETRDPSYSVAVTFVRSTGLHKSLSLLLLDSVKTDEVVEAAILKYGFENVKNIVVDNIKHTTTDYRDQWNDLLATIYSSQFDAHILMSIVKKGEKSPYFADFIARQKQMNTSEQLATSDVFKKAHKELINSLRINFDS